MSNGWTGGQYSVYRFVFGGYLFVHFVHLVPWGAELFSDRGMLPDGAASPLLGLFPNVFRWFDAPLFVVAALVAGAGLSLLLAVGRFDRSAAIALWYLWACLFGRNPLIANPGIPFVGWLLLAHACLPPRPYGALSARARIDPGGGWRMTPSIWGVAWVVMALGYSYAGYTKLISPSWLDGSAMRSLLENPLARPTLVRELALGAPAIMLQLATWGALALELAFAPLALIRRARPWLWLAMVSLHLGLIVLVDFADLTIGMLMIHAFTFDPGWLPGRRSAAPDVLYYDGTCGVCHTSVRFLLAEDVSGDAFRFAPLESDYRREAIGTASESDSVIVQVADGRILLRSDAVIHVLDRLGGLWRVLSWLLRVVPRPLRDRGYDLFAAVRYRIARRPDAACPIMPEAHRRRWVG